jgi:hypothetical protein
MPEDSPRLGFRLPHEISLVTTARLLRTFAASLVLALGALAAVAMPSPANASTACGKKVLLDWYDTGRIDRLYKLNCYEEAIDAIPADLRDYADAEDVITRALQAALHGNLTMGGDDPTPNGDGSTGNPRGGKNPTDPDGTGGSPQAAPDIDTSGPSTVPIPLLVLGGMSLLLLAAGGLGYVSRRRQAGHENDPDDFDPLA